MNKLFATLGLIMACTVAQAQSIKITTVSEDVTKPVKTNVNIYILSATYRLPSGVYVGGNVQKVYNEFADEKRFEGFVGYGVKVNNFTPFVEVTYGRRDYDPVGRTDYNYAALTTGLQYNFNQDFYGNVRYRTRNSTDSDISWRNDLYAVGLGVNLNPTTSLDFGYGVTKESYESKAFSVSLTNRF
jgi:hypothetical protein